MLYRQIKYVLNTPRQTVYILVIYSLLLGFLSLAVPISVQTLVNLVGVSLSIRPVISLITILFILLTTSFFVRIFQLKLVEDLQRKVFVNTLFRIISCIYKVDFNDLMKINVREKLNRIFELKFLQKSIAVIFIILLDIFLQTLFCVIILAFYHPMFLVFDILLVLCIVSAIFLPMKAGYEAGLSESTAVYNVVEWFEEKTAEFLSFRQRPIERSIQKIDTKLCDYLDSRSKFFSVILRQHIYIGLTYIFINILLLGIGSYLIINGQLSIGQLIAAELLVNIMLLGLLKFSQYLYDCYGFLVGVRKVLDLLEIAKKEEIPQEHQVAVLAGKVTDVEIKLNDHNYFLDFKSNVINTLSLPTVKVQTLLNSFFDDTAKEVIKIDKVCIRNYKKEQLGEFLHIASGVEVVSGTVLDNLCESGYSQAKLRYLSELLEIFDISFLEQYFEQKIDSQIVKYNLEFDTLVLLKVNIIRAILKQPKLLILIDSYGLTNRCKDKTIVQILENLMIPTLIISIE
ncbi:ABC transporter ATP-binding protein [Allofrancisella guangzhouensis]|uniref:ABC transporter ATP-binding protein n=1 Tax=Allofrancisella guangzhouensis TaxID=594679 RepID=A0A0A8E5N9_9GAMM|nr:ABC transporter ATP-binding protein/permease [Allofrancisella guangzhouensis]AJC49525.1 ABC transporter ATP-binding protein [Allofrancisella guangzhouensis]MBK2027618.1 ABC transporter ATP-binding protein [Allofrancisella guangzhouensis]MBK2044069.1 ABC transporter ATP-binding protein [Allofrancisella guangzhouensis]MBK2046517.1 ABC transporter ATP-binding protein [Allofrancisella guangzhouensis]